MPLSGGATPPETRWNGERLQGTLSRFVSRSACFGGMKSVQVPVGEELERVKGIEPSYAAWEAAVLPLNYTRKVEPA